MIVECSKKGGFRNTGAIEQCLEGLTIRTAVAIPGFKFDSVEDAKSKAKWDEAIAAKKIFPLYEAEEWTSANTDDTVFEGRTRNYVTALGKKIITYTSFLSFCSHYALKSFNRKPMQLFEFTEDKAILGVVNEDGEVKGQEIMLEIGIRLPATADRPPGALVTINYLDRDELEDGAAVLRPTWNPIDVQGIYDVTLVQQLASAESIHFKAYAGCNGGDQLLTSLEQGDLVLLDNDGNAHSFSLVAADANGVYELTGTGFQTGFTLELDGVVEKVEGLYESPEPMTVDTSAPSL